ncbi:MAG: nucleotide exchange factor GrpE [Gaiellaceae bacterium]
MADPRANGEEALEDGVAGQDEVGQEEPSPDDLRARLAEAEALRDRHLEQLQRIAADFDNYRKRVAREQQSLVARAHEKLVRELLPVLDDLERALRAAGEHEEAKLEEGVALVQRQLREVLAKEGLHEIETDGFFDPHEHEALMTQPAEAEEGTILQVIQKGYRLGDRVLRPARVVVAAEPPGA